MINPIPRIEKRCLLIVPVSFYSFHQQVAQELERLGYSVDVLNDEFPANSIGKILGKIALPVLRKLTLSGLKARLNEAAQYDLALIIKGRGLGPQALEFLRAKAKRIVGYNFDSFRFNPSPLDWHHLTHRFATFDILDARDHKLPLVHLFSAVQSSAPIRREYDISVIQRVHSDRLLFTELLLKSLPSSARPYVFLYESSLLTFLLGFFRHPVQYVRLWRYISFKPLSYVRAMDILAKSSVTFDYAHPHQSGITIRCFEAQSLGVSVLTNNPEALECGLFSVGSIEYFPKNADTVTIARLLASLLKKKPEVRCRNIEMFMENLLIEDFSQKTSF